MSKQGFTVTARWDDEAKVFYSEGNVLGLHIEAETMEEFDALLAELTPDLIASNHPATPRGSRRLRRTSP